MREPLRVAPAVKGGFLKTVWDVGDRLLPPPRGCSREVANIHPCQYPPDQYDRDVLIVLTTCPALEAAEALAEQLVEARLAACVQVLPRLTSIYWWEGAVQKDAEFLLLVKTVPEKWEELSTFIIENHTYEVPEIVAIQSEKVSPSYSDWLHGVLN